MSPWEDKTMTDLLAPRARAAIAAIFLCCVAPSIATAADRGLGNDAAAACAALSGTGTGTTKIDAAALTEPQPLAVAASGPTPAARISPATPAFCRVRGHIDPTDPKAPSIRFELNLPLNWNGRSVQYGGGIFARVPVINWVGLQHAGTRAGLATAGEGWIRPAQVKLVHDAVLAACDAQDGVADGLVEDAVGCKARFDPAKLLCANGAGGDQCLSAAQVAAIRTACALQIPVRAR